MSFFLFVIFTVYAMLPLDMRDAITAGVTSSLSHLLVLGLCLGPQPDTQPALLPQVSAQEAQAVCGAGSAGRCSLPLGIHQLFCRADSVAGCKGGSKVQTQTWWSWSTVQARCLQTPEEGSGPRGRGFARGPGRWGQMWITEPSQRM